MKPHKERFRRSKRRWFIKVFGKALVILNMHKCNGGLRKLTEEKLLQNTYKCPSWKCLLKAENATGFAFAWATEGCCQVCLMSERGDEMEQRGLLCPRRAWESKDLCSGEHNSPCGHLHCLWKWWLQRGLKHGLRSWPVHTIILHISHMLPLGYVWFWLTLWEFYHIYQCII